MKPVKLVVFDFDGVLTDNRVFVFEDGSEAVCCNRADGLAFDMLREAGLPAIILSTETNKVVAARARKLRVPCSQGIADKGRALAEICVERGVEPEHVLYVGNDINDVPAMKLAGFAVAVADAHPAAKQAARLVLKTKGGEGVAREVVEFVLAGGKERVS